jgi:HD-GYP domain-containing protein (c-di-GMP phosphodiesterase class II)/GAF domain-containing protein
MPTELALKLEGVRDFQKILETVVKELGETYAADVSQIVLSNPLDRNLTSICEYKLYPEANAAEMPVTMSFPLPLEGAGLGAVTLARRAAFHENEVNWIRITLAELSDVIRHAQINDIIQRETFRNTFLAEIQNVMHYMPGIGDALFMVVNILGKVLKSSRCLFICVDDEKAGWKCYEFWQQGKVQSCQEFGWPTTDSAIVARSLLATSPMIVTEANASSRLTPVQEELQLLGVRSLLGVPLRSESATHGCIILHHCEMRHEWTRGEIDMLQNVADTVAEVLAKLPEEKRAREPIMRLHQRDVVEVESEGGKESILAVRRALRGALGQTAIPTASKSGAPKPSKSSGSLAKPPAAAGPAGTPALPPQPAGADAPSAAPAGTTPGAQPAPPNITPVTSASASAAASPLPDNIGELANSLLQQARSSGDAQVADEVSSTLQSLLQGMGVTSMNKAAPTLPAADEAAQTPAPPAGDSAVAQKPPAQGWGDLDAIATPTSKPPKATPAAAPSAPPAGNGADAASQWGNLDAIPTPTSGPARSGLGGSMFGKKPSSAAAASPLLASLHKDKTRFQSQQEKPEFVDGGTMQIDEAQAQAKLQQVLASASNPTSDYIFATPGLDPRMLGRIDGWITQIEQKDKFSTPHSMQVAEYSVGIGRVLGLAEDELNALRLAAILHDVGKLALAAPILQKPEEELSDSELLLIMKHPIDGATLVEGFPELAYLAPVILAHHEEFNGNGFPAGLSGEEIPLAARIIHVASDYHNMVSPTKRRASGITPQEAQQQLQAQAGSAYDPNVVAALIACVQQGLVAASR